MKKQTIAQRIQEYSARNPEAKAKEIATALGLRVAQVYTTRWKLNNPSTSAKSQKAKVKDKTETESQGAVIAVQKRQIEGLQRELEQITGWCNHWKQKFDAKERELTEVKITFLDATAIIRYLERKIVDQLKQGDE